MALIRYSFGNLHLMACFNHVKTRGTLDDVSLGHTQVVCLSREVISSSSLIICSSGKPLMSAIGSTWVNVSRVGTSIFITVVVLLRWHYYCSCTSP